MRWSERQRAMLREIGIPPFWPEGPTTETDRPAPPATEGAAPTPASAQAPAVTPVPVRPAVPPPASSPAQGRPASARAAGGLSRATPPEVGLGARPAGIDTMDWATLREAVAKLRAHPGITRVLTSPVFETDPVGGPEQPAFLNAVFEVTTTLTPEELLAVMQRIESEAGRMTTLVEDLLLLARLDAGRSPGRGHRRARAGRRRHRCPRAPEARTLCHGGHAFAHRLVENVRDRSREPRRRAVSLSARAR